MSSSSKEIPPTAPFDLSDFAFPIQPNYLGYRACSTLTFGRADPIFPHVREADGQKRHDGKNRHGPGGGSEFRADRRGQSTELELT
jgi:hypothetical protein